MLVFVFSALVTLLDILFKRWIVIVLPMHGHMELIPGVIGLTRLYNEGAAFGVFTGMRWELVAVKFVAILVFIFILLRYDDSFWGRLGLGAMLGGAGGNFFDRLFNGHVVDMFELQFINFAIFNIADIFIVSGALTFVIATIIFTLKEKDEAVKAGVGIDDSDEHEPQHEPLYETQTARQYEAQYDAQYDAQYEAQYDAQYDAQYEAQDMQQHEYQYEEQDANQYEDRYELHDRFDYRAQHEVQHESRYEQDFDGDESADISHAAPAEYLPPEYEEAEYEKPEYIDNEYDQPEYERREYEQPEYEEPKYEQPEYEQPDFKPADSAVMDDEDPEQLTKEFVLPKFVLPKFARTGYEPLTFIAPELEVPKVSDVTEPSNDAGVKAQKADKQQIKKPGRTAKAEKQTTQAPPADTMVRGKLDELETLLNEYNLGEQDLSKAKSLEDVDVDELLREYGFDDDSKDDST